MGVAQGAQLAATAANIKNQKAQRLSQEEKDKIYMEIAKMNADIQKQQFDIQKESFELKLQADQAQAQQNKIDRYNALMEGAKRSKVTKQWNQMLIGGAGTPDMRTRAMMLMNEGIIPGAQEQDQMEFIQEGFEPEESTPKSTVGKIIADMNAMSPDNPLREIYNRALEKAVAQSGQKIEVGPDGSITLTQGPGAMQGSPLSKPTQTQIEKDVLGLSTQLGDLTALKKDYSADYLTYRGRFKGWLGKIKSSAEMKLSPEEKAFIGKKRRFIEGVEQIFNKYRKDVTGAQAAMKELAMLRDSIINKELAPDEFEYSYNRYISQIQRQYRLKRKFLREGIIDKKALGKRIDQAYINNEDTDSDDMDVRGDEIANELMKKGVPAEQIQQQVLSILKQEGYY